MAAPASLLDVPLFPLRSVLFPGGQLALRIFEPRYLDMVRECARRESGFGICLILQGRETGVPTVPAAVGTIARIADFHTDGDGLLAIVVEGGARFRVARSRARSDGLLRGSVILWPPEPSQEVPVEFALLQSIAERLVETMAPHFHHVPRSAYADAGWVGCRLAELLPLDVEEQQRLLELTDPLQRLAELRDVLPRFQKP